jgi:Flp pilus assembly protein TadG
MKVHMSDNQKSKIQQAVEKGEPVSIRLTYKNLQENDVLTFTMSQLNTITEAFNNRKGVTIKMSKTQV